MSGEDAAAKVSGSRIRKRAVAVLAMEVDDHDLRPAIGPPHREKLDDFAVPACRRTSGTNAATAMRLNGISVDVQATKTASRRVALYLDWKAG
jgi:hypothetical protein